MRSGLASPRRQRDHSAKSVGRPTTEQRRQHAPHLAEVLRKPSVKRFICYVAPAVLRVFGWLALLARSDRARIRRAQATRKPRGRQWLMSQSFVAIAQRAGAS